MSSSTPENPITVEESRYQADTLLFRFIYLSFPQWDGSVSTIDVGLHYSLKELAMLGLGDVELGKQVVQEYLAEKQNQQSWLRKVIVGDRTPSVLEIGAHSIGSRLRKKS